LRKLIRFEPTIACLLVLYCVLHLRTAAMSGKFLDEFGCVDKVKEVPDLAFENDIEVHAIERNCINLSASIVHSTMRPGAAGGCTPPAAEESNSRRFRDLLAQPGKALLKHWSALSFALDA